MYSLYQANAASKSEAPSSSAEKRAPWMKSMSLSMRDLMSESTDPQQESHMEVSAHEVRKATSLKPELLPSYYDNSRRASSSSSSSSSSQDRNFTSRRQIQDEGSKQPIVKRRKNKSILDKAEDDGMGIIRQKLSETTMLERSDSDARFPRLEFSESFVQEQETILAQLTRSKSNRPKSKRSRLPIGG